jgi:hypothetical protein
MPLELENAEDKFAAAVTVPDAAVSAFRASVTAIGTAVTTGQYLQTVRTMAHTSFLIFGGLT